MDFGSAVFVNMQGRIGWLRDRTQLDLYLAAVRFHPVTIIDIDDIPRKGFFRADDHLIECRIEFDNVERLVIVTHPAADTKAFALADCVMHDSVMCADLSPVNMDDIAGFFGIGAHFFDDAGIIAVRHEADILTIGLITDQQAEAFRMLAGDIFRPRAQRKT